MIKKFLAVLPVCAPLLTPAEPGDVLKTLPANSWYEIASTTLSAPPPAVYFGIDARFFPAIISAWSGGIYDSQRNRLVIWGGGHNDYYGNQIYAFAPDSLKWQRLNWPSPINPDKSQCIETLADGAANARHTYNHLAYIAHTDRMFAHGGSLACLAGGGGTVTWTFDFKTLKWQNMNPSGTPPADDCCSMSSVYDPATKKVYYRSKGTLAAYDYDANRWTTLRSQSRGGNEPTSVIDTKRRLMLTLGSGIFEVVDLSNSSYPITSWTTTGGSSIIGAQAPGVNYVAALDRLVAWAGGGVYTLDLDTKVWTSDNPAGFPTATSTGTYGRWQYIPKQNGFLLITATADNVHFYKKTGGVKIEDKAVAGADMRAFPNPVVAGTPFALSFAGPWRVYDIRGKQVWNGIGKTLLETPGIYFASPGAGRSVQKVAVIK